MAGEGGAMLVQPPRAVIAPSQASKFWAGGVAGWVDVGDKPEADVFQFSVVAQPLTPANH
jgi:hypothetical protein